MDRAVYEAMAEDEDHHWWFIGRRAVLAGLIARSAKPEPGGRVLDMGCGSGGNMRMLAEFGQLDAVEYDSGAREMAAARNVTDVKAGGLPDALDVPDGRYDLIGLFDVLEHIEDDLDSISVLGRKLSPNGRLVLSVPALQWLWSDHDETHHHFRRYTKTGLRELLEDAGLRVNGVGYFNTILFPVALIQRMLQRLTGLGSNAARMPSPLVNRALAAAFSLEQHLIGRIPMPIGLSLWAIAECPRSDQ